MIIDTHTHIGTILDYDMHLEQLLRSMTAHFIDFSLVSNIEAVETDPQGNPLPPELTKPQNQLLRETLDTVRPHADKLGVLPWMRVYCEMPDAEFRSILEQNRRLIYGLKLTPSTRAQLPTTPAWNLFIVLQRSMTCRSSPTRAVVRKQCRRAFTTQQSTIPS